MEKTKLIKIFLVIIVSLALILSATSVFAANETGNNTTTFIDVTEAGNNTPANNTPANNTPANNTTNNVTLNNATNNANTNLVASTNNSSSYNNTNLPKTGLAESGSVVCIVFALAVSAIYAFKKIRDYNV